MIDIRDRWKQLPGMIYVLRTPRGHLTQKAEDFICEVIRANKWVCNKDIARKYEVGINTADRLVSKVHAELKQRQPLSYHRFGFRDDTYFNETDLLSSPYYNPKELTGEERAIFLGKIKSVL